MTHQHSRERERLDAATEQWRILPGLVTAGMNLPPSERKDVALRLLESLEVVDQEPVDDAWTTEIGSRMDDRNSANQWANAGLI